MAIRPGTEDEVLHEWKSDREKNKTNQLYVLLADHQSKYSLDARLKACYLFAIEGNMAEVQRKTGIPYETLKDWKDQEWWPVALAECRKRKQDELDSMLSQVIHDAVGKVADRIAEGDFFVGKMAP
jgi:hypothetical protein